jgi:hypothetical protein
MIIAMVKILKFYFSQWKVSIICLMSSVKNPMTGASESLLGITLKYNDPLRKLSVLSVTKKLMDEAVLPFIS